MKTLNKIALIASLAIASLGVASTASAQDYNGWVDVNPNGSVMYDQWGYQHEVNPYAYDTQVDWYGNQYSSDSYMEPNYDRSDLTFTNPYATDYSSSYDTGSSSSTYVPYSSPVDSHQAFINSIYE